MKTGRAAKIFGVDPNTITDWTDRYHEYFTSDAQGHDRTQRDYHPEDLIVINTIKNLRSRNTDWENIAARLAAGDREATLPPEAMSIQGETAITVYAQLKALEVQLTNANQEIERLRRERKDDQERYEANVAELNREIGKWQAKYEILREQMEDDK
jgi:DNA-binding transcriptional MerR regulator